jgi:spore coat polysaccharide biosynthesis protein SpsF
MSNSLERTFPVGLDAEIFTYESLSRAYREAHREYEREHVTPYIYQHPDTFRLRSYTNDVNLSRYRWTLDTLEDFTLINEIYNRLYKGEIFTTASVLELLEENPELTMINAHIRQKQLGE